jgi:hypothetical protein
VYRIPDRWCKYLLPSFFLNVVHTSSGESWCRNQTDCFYGSRRPLIQTLWDMSQSVSSEIHINILHLSPSKWFTLQTVVYTWILCVPFVALHSFMSSLLCFLYVTILTILCSSHKSWTGSWGTVLKVPLTLPLLNPNLFMSTIFSNTCTILICSVFCAWIRCIKFIKDHQNCTLVLWCNFIIIVIYYDHQHVSATHMAILRVISARIQIYYIYVCWDHSSV